MDHRYCSHCLSQEAEYEVILPPTQELPVQWKGYKNKTITMNNNISSLDVISFKSLNNLRIRN